MDEFVDHVVQQRGWGGQLPGYQLPLARIAGEPVRSDRSSEGADDKGLQTILGTGLCVDTLINAVALEGAGDQVQDHSLVEPRFAAEVVVDGGATLTPACRQIARIVAALYPMRPNGSAAASSILALDELGRD